MQREPIRMSFGTMLMLLLMVVSAGLALLIYYAMRVPAITSELNAWLGRTDAVVSTADARQAQVVFAMFLYAAPMALGLLVWMLHLSINWLDRFTRKEKATDDASYRME